MNILDFARRYEAAYVVAASIVIFIASVFYSAIEPGKNWGFLICPIGYTAFVYDEYKCTRKLSRRRSFFIIFFLIPWLVSTGFAAHRAMINLGLI